MDKPTSDHLARLEAEVEADPTSEEARACLLDALYMSAEPSHPRRLELISWFLEHNPRHYICSSPLAHVDPEAAPDAYRDLKARWLSLAEPPNADPVIVRGAAAFVAAESLDEGKRLLRKALAQRPDDAWLWCDLGRMSRDPHERLSAFEQARAAGEDLPNLLVWIAETSVEAGEYGKAVHAAQELMQLVEEARTHFGDKLDWPDQGRDLWQRARNACATDQAAGQLTDAIAQHAYRKHWGHTVLGLVACHDGDVEQAVVHLRASADVRPDYRLSSYGPSFDLVREVCARGRWKDGLEYLLAWEKAWDDHRLKDWISAVKEQRLPDAAGSS